MDIKKDVFVGCESLMILNNFVKAGCDLGQVFVDFVDLTLNSFLSYTENSKGRLEGIPRSNKYEERSCEIINKYKTGKMCGKAGQYFGAAVNSIVSEIGEKHTDVLCELYKDFFLDIENGYGDNEATEYLKLLEDARMSAGITDVSCGTGKILMCGGIKNPDMFLYGKEKCLLFAKICAINMYSLKLNSIIEFVDSNGKMVKQWRTLKENSIVEYQEEDAVKTAAFGVNLGIESMPQWLN